MLCQVEDHTNVLKRYIRQRILLKVCSLKLPSVLIKPGDIDENVMDAEWQDTSDKTSKHRATKVEVCQLH